MAKNEVAVGEEIRAHLGDDGQITCVSAHKVAEMKRAEPAVVGEIASKTDIRITRCQLGLFGFAPQKGMPGYKVVKKLDSIDESVAQAVKYAAADGKAPCLELWQIAAQHDLSRLDIGNIAETLELKVSPCQLGCF